MSYAARHFSPNMFFFRDHIDTEARSAAICQHGPTRMLVNELCYQLDLKIVAVNEKRVHLCTRLGMTVAYVDRHFDHYSIGSPFILKERGDNRSNRTYKALRPLMEAIKNEINLHVLANDQEVFKKLYGGIVCRHGQYISGWFDSTEGRKETGLLNKGRWEPLLDINQQIDIVAAIFENRASYITEHPAYREVYEKIINDRTGADIKHNLLKRMKANSTLVMMHGNGQVICADVKLRHVSDDDFVLDTMQNYRRVHSMAELPEIASHFGMMKSAYPENLTKITTYGCDRYYHEFETMVFVPSGTGGTRTPDHYRHIANVPSMMLVRGEVNE